MNRFRVFATRQDGSSKVSPPLLASEAAGRVHILLTLEPAPKTIIVEHNNPAVEYVETGPTLVGLDAIMSWRQPDDDVTNILR